MPLGAAPPKWERIFPGKMHTNYDLNQIQIKICVALHNYNIYLPGIVINCPFYKINCLLLEMLRTNTSRSKKHKNTASYKAFTLS